MVVCAASLGFVQACVLGFTAALASWLVTTPFLLVARKTLQARGNQKQAFESLARTRSDRRLRNKTMTFAEVLLFEASKMVESPSAFFGILSSGFDRVVRDLGCESLFFGLFHALKPSCDSWMGAASFSGLLGALVCRPVENYLNRPGLHIDLGLFKGVGRAIVEETMIRTIVFGIHDLLGNSVNNGLIRVALALPWGYACALLARMVIHPFHVTKKIESWNTLFDGFDEIELLEALPRGFTLAFFSLFWTLASSVLPENVLGLPLGWPLLAGVLAVSMYHIVELGSDQLLAELTSIGGVGAFPEIARDAVLAAYFRLAPYFCYFTVFLFALGMVGFYQFLAPCCLLLSVDMLLKDHAMERLANRDTHGALMIHHIFAVGLTLVAGFTARPTFTTTALACLALIVSAWRQLVAAVSRSRRNSGFLPPMLQLSETKRSDGSEREASPKEQKAEQIINRPRSRVMLDPTMANMLARTPPGPRSPVKQLAIDVPLPLFPPSTSLGRNHRRLSSAIPILLTPVNSSVKPVQSPPVRTPPQQSVPSQRQFPQEEDATSSSEPETDNELLESSEPETDCLVGDSEFLVGDSESSEHERDFPELVAGRVSSGFVGGSESDELITVPPPLSVTAARHVRRESDGTFSRLESAVEDLLRNLDSTSAGSSLGSLGDRSLGSPTFFREFSDPNEDFTLRSIEDQRLV